MNMYGKNLWNLGISGEPTPVGRGEMDRGQYDEVLKNNPADFGCGGTVTMVSKDYLMDAGLLDERFGLYRIQDVELLARLGSQYCIWTEPSVAVIDKKSPYSCRCFNDTEVHDYTAVLRSVFEARNLVLFWNSLKAISYEVGIFKNDGFNSKERVKRYVLTKLCEELRTFTDCHYKIRSLISGISGVYSDMQLHNIERVLEIYH